MNPFALLSKDWHIARQQTTMFADVPSFHIKIKNHEKVLTNLCKGSSKLLVFIDLSVKRVGKYR